MSRASALRLERITSRRNALVGTFRGATAARPAGVALLDGGRLVNEALRAGVIIDVAACTDRAFERGEDRALARELHDRGVRLVLATEEVLQAMSPSTTPAGVVALARVHGAGWEALDTHAATLLVVAVNVQDPGNLGALVRIAEAGGADGVVAAGDTADPFGWKALRGAMGSAFRLPVLRDRSLPRTVDRLRALGLRLVAAVPRGRTKLGDCDLTRPTAVLLGGEGRGLDTGMLGEAGETLTIPIRPPVESLNVAVAGALIVFEAARQRGYFTS